jgi:Flp pilus assembly protein CpaB
MNIENKKQFAVITLAIGLGLVASMLTGTHIQKSIKQETDRFAEDYQKKAIEPMKAEIDSLRGEMKRMAAVQQSMPTRGEGEQKGPEAAAPKSTLALKTPPGKRAYTVQIDSLSAVGGMVNPGDYVDIIAHMNIPDPSTNEQQTVSSIVFQNVQILAVGTNLQAPGGYEQQQGRALNITFALTPEESGLMSFLGRNAQEQLILRPPAETETEVMQIATWSTLADYVYEKQGTELLIPRAKAMLQPVSPEGKEEVKPFIQIFRAGQEK